MKALFENWRGYMSETKDSENVSKAVIIKENGALLLLRSGVTLQEPIEKLYVEDNMTFYKAQMPDEKITLSHEHDDHKFVTSDNIPENISGKFSRAIKKAL